MPIKKREFSNEEIEYIINNWNKESIYNMAKRFNCSWNTVAEIGSLHNLVIPKANIWTEDEINKLKELSKKYHYEKIANILNRSKGAVYQKAKELGITLFQNNRKWTEEEKELLKELWGNKSTENIARILKRTKFSIKNQATKMQLGSIIKNNYSKISISDLTDLLKVSRHKIVRKWAKLGLKIEPIRATYKTSYYGVTWKELITFLETHQDEWDSRNLETNMLGVEPDWLKEKRLKDIKENPSWYRYWTEEEINIATSLFKSGKTYKEIAIILKRSSKAVKEKTKKLENEIIRTRKRKRRK